MNKLLLTFTVILILASCSNTQNDFSAKSLASNACECMIEEHGKGRIDERLSICLMNEMNANAKIIQEAFYPNESFEKALENHFLATTSSMIHNCDSYFIEMDEMYTNMYPKIDYSDLKDKIASITDSLENQSLNDSMAIKLLNDKIKFLTQARLHEQALDVIEILSTKYSRESETHWARAYIYRDQEKYKEAIEELEKAIRIGNESTIIFKELIIEKMRR